MKRIEWSKADRLKHLEDNTTPFMEIDILDKRGGFTRPHCRNYVNLRLYWTAGGMYGCQVQTVLRGLEAGSFGDKTSGCGYSKTTEALTNAFIFLRVKPREYVMHASDAMGKYKVGGNYHLVKDAVKIKKGGSDQ